MSVLIIQTKSRSFPELFSGRTSAQLPTEGQTKNNAATLLKFFNKLGLVKDRVPWILQSDQSKNEDAALTTLPPPPIAHVVYTLKLIDQESTTFSVWFFNAVLSFLKLLSLYLQRSLFGNVTSVLKHFRPTILGNYCNIGPTTAVGRIHSILLIRPSP